MSIHSHVFNELHTHCGVQDIVSERMCPILWKHILSEVKSNKSYWDVTGAVGGNQQVHVLAEYMQAS